MCCDFHTTHCQHKICHIDISRWNSSLFNLAIFGALAVVSVGHHVLYRTQLFAEIWEYSRISPNSMAAGSSGHMVRYAVNKQFTVRPDSLLLITKRWSYNNNPHWARKLRASTTMVVKAQKSWTCELVYKLWWMKINPISKINGTFLQTMDMH